MRKKVGAFVMGTAVLFSLLVLAPLSRASSSETFGEFITHLEFIGYTVSVNDDGIVNAKHPNDLSFSMKEFKGGVLCAGYFGGSDHAKGNQGAFLQLVNELNLNAAAARFYIDSDGDLAIEGYYPGAYEKKRFGVFIDVYNESIAQLSNMSDRLDPYLD